MKRSIEITGIVLGLAGLIVAVLNWLFPFSPVGNSPISDVGSSIAISTKTPFEQQDDTQVLITPDVRSILMYDPFTDYSYESGYNPDLWGYYCKGDYCDNSGIKLDNGVTRFEINGEGGVDLYGTDTWWISQVDYVESKFQILEYEGADNGDLHLGIGADHLTGRWQALCYVEGRNSSSLKLYYTCSVGSYDFDGNEIYDYVSPSIPIQFSEWHTARIKINPENFEVNLYLDNEVIGRYTPSNMDDLIDKKFDVNVGLTSAFSYRHIVGNVDDFLVRKMP